MTVTSKEQRGSDDNQELHLETWMEHYLVEGAIFKSTTVTSLGIEVFIRFGELGNIVFDFLFTKAVSIKL